MPKSLRSPSTGSGDALKICKLRSKVDKFVFCSSIEEAKGEERWRLSLSNILRLRYLKIGSSETREKSSLEILIIVIISIQLKIKVICVNMLTQGMKEVLYSGKELGLWYLVFQPAFYLYDFEQVTLPLCASVSSSITQR